MAEKQKDPEAPVKDTVTLAKKTAKGSSAEKETKEFGLKHANELLKLRNTQWELADDKYTHNGTELAKK